MKKKYENIYYQKILTKKRSQYSFKKYLKMASKNPSEVQKAVMNKANRKL